MSKKQKIYFNQPQLPFEEWTSDFSDSPHISEVSKNPAAEASSDTGVDRTGPEVNPDAKAEIPGSTLSFISFGSGSSGNSCYIGTKEGGIVVDAGIRADIIEDTLRRYGIGMKHIKGLLLTHDHSDHVRYSYNLLRNNRHLSLFCTPRVLNGLLRRHNISKRIKEYHTPIFKEIPFKICGMEITAFEVPHDGTDNMGFSIEFGDTRFVLATDLGYVAERARYYLSSANYMMIESNYDAEMLRIGRYPEYLKARIKAENGHLDNVDTASFLAEIVNPSIRHIFLCHLSKDNNTPEKALEKVRGALEEKGLKVGTGENTLDDRKADVQLTALPRYDATRLYVLGGRW